MDNEEDPGYLPPSKLPPIKERRDADAWVRILNTVLPSRLRPVDTVSPDVTAADTTSPLTPRDVAVALWRAQKSQGLDILTYMGVDKGRWKAVTWLLSRIIDHVWEGVLDTHHHKLPGPWNGVGSLHAISASKDKGGIVLHIPEEPVAIAPSLDDLTGELSPSAYHAHRKFSHELVGVVWSSLGNMIVADAARASQSEDKAITPEILEIIALFHHHGIMPSSIYSYEPSSDSNALHQPPTLHLLSSNILTSLSDAAWRAHESLVVEEARSQGGEYLSMRPEIPGSMYRVRVAGLRHEIWLELVLWSCLHGGWVEEGASVLQQVARHESWSAQSWREVAGLLTKTGQDSSINWADLIHRPAPAHTDLQSSKTRDQWILSTEVITAFVYALLDRIRGRVGQRGIPAAKVWQFVTQIKSFLEKRRLSLAITSWDAVVYRFIESQGIDTNEDPALTERVVRVLSSEFGKELSATNSLTRGQDWQPHSAYILDGTAAAMGLMHRVLQSHVQAGDIGAASRTFEVLQQMTDKNKRRSLEAFFEKRSRQTAEEINARVIDFESGLSGIEYPGFYPNYPVTVLAPLLDLVTDTGSLNFGKLLLQTEDLDEPVISEALWVNPILGPAIIRFASSVDDEALVAKVVAKRKGASDGDYRLTVGSLLAILEGQVRLQQWAVMDTILTKLREVDPTLESFTFDGRNGVVGILACALVQEVHADRGPSFKTPSAKAKGKDVDGFGRVWQAFLGLSDMDSRSDNAARLRSVLLVLGCIDKKWEKFIMSMPGLMRNNLTHQQSTISYFALNRIIVGVTAKYGAEHGVRFLGKFYHAATDESIVAPPEASEEEGGGGVMPMSVRRPGVVIERPLSLFSVRLSKGVRGADKVVTFFGKYRPPMSVTSSILEQGLKEHGEDREKREWYISWARRLMRLVGQREEAANREIERVRASIEDKVGE